MRIVAGIFRGRRLAAPRGRDVRPTSDRVREAIFSILGDLDGASVLDLFAGTGAMGLEALSRGAVHATFVEIDRRAIDVIQRNIDATVVDDLHRVDVIKGDATRVAGSLALRDERFDVIFFDPPYEQTEDLVRRMDRGITQLCHTETRVVLEVATRHAGLVEAAAEQWGLSVHTTRTYGDTSVSILVPPPPA